MLPLTIFFPVSSTYKIPFHSDWLQTSKLIQTPFQSKSDHKEAFPVFPLLGHHTTNYLSTHEIFSWMFAACNQIQPTQHIVLRFLFSFICSSWCRWMILLSCCAVFCQMQQCIKQRTWTCFPVSSSLLSSCITPICYTTRSENLQIIILWI